ncbi:helix-turn-helix transcriptional regulator [Salinifilum aidingensis]
MSSAWHRRPVVGRESELAELTALLEQARTGNPRAVVVAGPAGVGKTALLDEFLHRHPELHVLRACGLSWERSVRFGVAEQLLCSAAPEGACTGFPPPSAQPATAADAERADAVDTGDDVVETGRRLLSRSVPPCGHAVLLIIDDAHWADTASLQAVSSALRRAGSARLLVVAASSDDREEESAERAQRLLTGHRVPVLRPGPLLPEHVRDMAAWIGVDVPLPAAHRLAEHTAGTPRHIDQLLRECPEQQWAGRRPYLLPAPRAVTTEVVNRLRTCSATARAVVEAAAVLGETVSLADAVALAETVDAAPVSGPVAALDELCSGGLCTTAEGELRTLRFAAPLVRSAVRGTIPPARRQRLHHSAAAVVADEGARLSHRVAASPFPDADLAAELDRYAGDQAAQGAWPAAANALVQASELSPRRADHEHRLLRAADALIGAGHLFEAGAYTPAIQSFPPTAFRDAVLGYHALALGRSSDAEQLLADAWERCEPEHDPELAALICQRFVLHSLSRWRGADLVRWAQRARTLAGSGTPAVVESEAIIGLGMAVSGQVEQAREIYAGSSTAAGAQAQRFQMARGWLSLALDDPLSARKDLQDAVPTQYRMGSVRISLWAQAWLARTEFSLGLWDEALRTVERARAQLDDSGIELLAPLVHWTGVQIRALRGDWELADEHLSRLTGAFDYEIMLLPARMAKAHYAEALSDYAGVLRALEPIAHTPNRELVDEPGFWPWQDIYANALVQTNRLDEADAFLEPHERRAAECGHRSAMARMGYVRGRLRGARGDIEQARRHFDTALENVAQTPMLYERARVNFAYGQTLRRAGKRRDADVVLHRARELYAAMRARTYVQRCDRELKAGGLHGHRSEAEAAELTAQENAVAKLVAEGRSNKQVAVELYVSVKTVQFHLTRIYGKLGVASRGELAARFHEEAGRAE